jgi:hypothetical protein
MTALSPSMKHLTAWTASTLLTLFSLGPSLPALNAAFSIDVRTTASDTADTAADRIYVLTNAVPIKAPSGTRLWVVIDRNGDGLPANPEPGHVLGADDVLVLEDVVPGQLPALFTGRYIRNGFAITDESLRNNTNAYILVWEFFKPLSEVPHYAPAAGARYDVKRVAATTVPDVGNAKVRIYTDVVATNLLGQAPPAPPSIGLQPQSQTVEVGDPVTLTVQAGGTLPLIYQWRKDGVDLDGQTNATLQMTSIQAVDQGRYTVKVSNVAGVVVSDEAVLTVLAPVERPGLENAGLAQEGGHHVFSFTFATQAGRTFQVQSTTTLSGNPVAWVNQGGAIPGTGQPFRFAENLGSDIIVPPVRFYRVLVQ